MSQHFLGEIQWSEVNPTFPQKKLKFLVNVVKRKNQTPDPIVLSVTQNGIVLKDIVSGVGQQSSDYTKYQTVEKGDFVMNHMDLLTGYVDISSYEGVTSPDYRVFQITDKEVLPEYLLKLFQCFYLLKIFYGYGQGVSMFGRWRFVDINFQNFKIPTPTKDQQEIILGLVETEEKNYFTLITQIEEQTRLYKRYSQSFIDNSYQELIKNKNTQMTKLKYISKFVTGNSLNSKQKNKFSQHSEDHYPYVSTENIDMKKEEINYEGKYKIPMTETKFSVCPKDTILFCTEGGSYGKKFQITDREVCFVNKLCSIQSGLNSEFLYNFFKTTIFKNDYYPRRNGLIEGVNMFEMGEIKIPVVSTEKQKHLVEEINQKLGKLNLMVLKMNKLKELLTNLHYKKTLQLLIGNH
jgi:hypothetical protein